MSTFKRNQIRIPDTSSTLTGDGHDAVMLYDQYNKLFNNNIDNEGLDASVVVHDNGLFSQFEFMPYHHHFMKVVKDILVTIH